MSDRDFEAGVVNAHPIGKAVLLDMARRVRTVNTANGWYDSDRSIGDGMMLLVSEIGEAFDAWREQGTDDQTITSHSAVKHGDKCGKCGRLVWVGDDVCPAAKPEGYGSELADVLIRLLDQADRDGVDLHAEFERKLAYNATRGYHHGGRKV